MAILHYALRKNNGELRISLRGWLFTILFLHANNDLRCWPSNKLLCDEVGFDKTTLVRAKDFLIAQQALVLVPHAHRMDGEKHLSPNKHVYQITGILRLENGEYLPTIHFSSPEAVQSHYNILHSLDVDDSLLKAFSATVEKSNSCTVQLLHNPPRSSIYTRTATEESKRTTLGADAPKGEKTSRRRTKGVVEKSKSKSSKPRKRNLFFDTIALHSHKVKDTTLLPKGSGQMITRAENKIKALDSEITVEKLKRFYNWYETDEDTPSNPTKDPDKLEMYYLQWMQSRISKREESKRSLYPPLTERNTPLKERENG